MDEICKEISGKLLTHAVFCCFSVHFEPPCYPQCYSIDIPEHLRPKAKYLKPDAIPTINTVVVGLGTDMKTTPVSKREDRMVSVII